MANPISSRLYDVAIVGGGVAGSSAAASLARIGLSVIVFERETTFRDRVRGESIHPWGVAEAEKLSLLSVIRAAGGRALPVWQRYTDREPHEPYRWADDFPDGFPEWTVSHPALQESLIEHAAACGATVVRPARVTALHPGSIGEIEVSVGDSTVSARARLFVGADGQRSATRRWIGVRTHRDPVHHSLGGSLLDGVALSADRAHQAYVPGGMVMMFPQGWGRARAYIVCDTARARELQGRDGTDAFVAYCAAALPANTFDQWKPAGPTAFFPNADVWSDQIAEENVVLIGDAAGANDPSLGHGLSLVFRDARELRDLLIEATSWKEAINEFGRRRAAYHGVLRAHAQWTGILTTECGSEADARRARVTRARERDPTAGGYAAIYALGPDGLVADEAARRHFFGEDLDH